MNLHLTLPIHALHGIASCSDNIYTAVLLAVAATSKWVGNDLALAASSVRCQPMRLYWRVICRHGLDVPSRYFESQPRTLFELLGANQSLLL